MVFEILGLMADTDASTFRFLRVLASAGAGKTHFLSTRVVEFLQERVGDFSASVHLSVRVVDFLRRLAGLTFTNRAAHQLRQRILDRVRGDSVLQRFYPYVLFHIDRMFLSTIDSALSRLVDPLLLLLDDRWSWTIEVGRFRVREWVRRYFVLTYARDEAFRSRVDRLLASRNMAFSEMVRAVSPRLSVEWMGDVSPEELYWGFEGCRQKVEERLFDAYSEFIQRFRRCAAGGGRTGVRGGPAEDTRFRRRRPPIWRMLLEEAVLQSGQEVYECFLQSDRSHFRRLSLENLVKLVKGGRRGGSSVEAFTEDEKEVIADLLYWVGLAHLSERVIEPSLPYWSEYAFIQRALRVYRSQFRVLFLSDIHGLFARMIRRDKEWLLQMLYEFLGMRLRYYLVDEFQDTSREQYEALKPLWEELCSGCGGELVVVGDVKQSIYQWRDADPEILAERVLKDFQPHATNPEETDRWLCRNFRSVSEIVELNSWLFGTGLPEVFRKGFRASSEEEPRYFWKMLKAWYAKRRVHQIPNRKSGQALGGVVFRVIRLGDAGEVRQDVRRRGRHAEKELVMADLAHCIQALHRKSVAYGDMLILVRKSDEMQLVAEYLLSSGVPVSLSGAIVLDQHPVTRFLHAFFEWMYWGSVGCSSSSLNFLRAKVLAGLARMCVPGGTRLQTEKAENQSIKKIWEAIEGHFPRWRELICQLPLSEAVLVIGGELLSCIESVHSPIGAPLREGLAAYLHYVLRLEWQGITTWHELFRIWASGDREVTTTHITGAGQTENAVEILTIHSAKGLEKRFVFLPFLSWTLMPRGGGRWDETFTISLDKLPRDLLPMGAAQGDLGVIPVPFSQALYANLQELAKALRSLQTPNNQERIQGFVQFVEEIETSVGRHAFEALNLLYVAFTRAEEGLFVWLVAPMATNPSDRKRTSSQRAPRSFPMNDWVYWALVGLEDTDTPAHSKKCARYKKLECRTVKSVAQDLSDQDDLDWLRTHRLDRVLARENGADPDFQCKVMNWFTKHFDKYWDALDVSAAGAGVMSEGSRRPARNLGDHLTYTIPQTVKPLTFPDREDWRAGEAFWQDIAQSSSLVSLRHQMQGTFLHKVLSQIRTIADLETLKGSRQLPVELKRILDRLMKTIRQDDRVNQFFQEDAQYKWEIYTEKDLFFQGKMYRVDRLMLAKDRQSAVVIDFKIAEGDLSAALDKWTRQVQQYMTVVQEIYGVGRVEGYLITPNQVINVPRHHHPAKPESHG